MVTLKHCYVRSFSVDSHFEGIVSGKLSSRSYELLLTLHDPQGSKKIDLRARVFNGYLTVIHLRYIVEVSFYISLLISNKLTICYYYIIRNFSSQQSKYYKLSYHQLQQQHLPIRKTDH